MTNEEAIDILKDFEELNSCVPEDKEAVNTAIQALEQEPCEDAISRQAVMNCFKKWQPYMATRLFGFEKELSSLPSVTPQPNTGHWKSFTHSAYHGIDDDGEPIWREVKVYHCNLCNRRTVIKENYCPNCGRRMEGGEG